LSYFLNHHMPLPKVTLITGKGGTGKSSTAGALALALAKRSQTVLADLDQRQSSARMLKLEVNGGDSLRPIENLELHSLALHQELERFIEQIVPLKAIARRMLRSHTFGYVTAALPGLEAFLILARLRQLADDAAAREGFTVIDAPASGGVLQLLKVPQGLRDLAPSGTLNRLALEIGEFLADPRRFGVWVTSRPERLAIREALETIARLRNESGIHCVAAVLNGIPGPLFSSTDYPRIQGLAAHRALALRRKTTFELSVIARRQFEEAGVAVIELPMLYTAEFERAQLQTLADVLEDLAQVDDQKENVVPSKNVRRR
jgi:anion-transporting  ArsA/GET3 family ATPase